MIPEFDKYAPHIWACFGFTIASLLLLTLLTWVRARRTAHDLSMLDHARRRDVHR